jgi:hypothetical protein
LAALQDSQGAVQRVLAVGSHIGGPVGVLALGGGVAEVDAGLSAALPGAGLGQLAQAGAVLVGQGGELLARLVDATVDGAQALLESVVGAVDVDLDLERALIVHETGDAVAKGLLLALDVGERAGFRWHLPNLWKACLK